MKQSILSLFLLVATGGVKVTKGQNSTEPGSGQWRICGVNYTQVLKNCNTNPKCPTGDNCPVGYICYQLSEDLCPPLTSAPSTATTTAPSASNSTNFASAFSVCAASFSEATNLCYDPTKTCTTCNNATEACFNVRPYQCTTGGETGGETGGNNTDAPTAVQAQTEPPSTAPSLAPTTAKPTPSPTIVTVAPTTPNRFFCATNWDTVDDNCNTATPCPNGQRDCTTAGMTCYEIQSDKCMGTSTTSPTVGTSGSTSAPVGTSGSTSAPTPTSGFSFATKAPSPSKS